MALCDNKHQGIVPVPAKLGNGKDPLPNLFWGAAYGIKSYFKYKTTDWKVVKSFNSENPYILEIILFSHKSEEVYILADAYNGAKIKAMYY